MRTKSRMTVGQVLILIGLTLSLFVGLYHLQVAYEKWRARIAYEEFKRLEGE